MVLTIRFSLLLGHLMVLVDPITWEANWELVCQFRLAFLYSFCVYRFSLSFRSATAISDVARACRSKKARPAPTDKSLPMVWTILTYYAGPLSRICFLLWGSLCRACETIGFCTPIFGAKPLTFRKPSAWPQTTGPPIATLEIRFQCLQVQESLKEMSIQFLKCLSIFLSLRTEFRCRICIGTKNT